MTRKKLNLAYIPNDSVRKSTFNKRKKGFMKKINELSVLCDVDACAVICSPFNANPDVWPSNSGVKKVVEKFEMMPEMEKEKKMVNQEGFLKQSITKTIESNTKKMNDNAERTMKEAMFQIIGGKGDMLNLNDENRDDLCKYIDQYLKELIHHRNETLNQPPFEYGESSSAATTKASKPIAEVGGSSSFPNTHVVNSSQLENELWAFRPIVSPTRRGEQVDIIGSDEQIYCPMLNLVGAYNQFGYPTTVGHDEICNQNHDQEWLVDQKTNNLEDIGFPAVDDNTRYDQQHP